LLGVFLAKKYKKSRAAKAIAKILGANVDEMDRSFVIQKLLNDKSFFARIQRITIAILSSKEYDFNKVMDVFVEEFKEFGINRDEALEIYLKIKDILLDSEIIGTIWRISGAISQLETKLDLETNNIKKAINEQNTIFKTSMDGTLAQVFAKMDHSFTQALTTFSLLHSNLRLITSLSEFGKGDRNCWMDAYFSDADIKSGYDARRPITDDVIKSVESHEGTVVCGDAYLGKTTLIKRVMFELADKGYAAIDASDAAVESNASHIKELLISLSKTYPKLVLVADDAHKASHESFFKIFN
jgi:hypothetical protein